MKRIILLVMMALPMMAMAQLPHFTKVADKYNAVEGITAMSINKQMISMFAGGDASYDFVDNIQILLSENVDFGAQIVKDAHKAVKKSKIEELISQNENGAIYRVYAKKDGDTFTDLVVLIENNNPAGFIVITGKIPEAKLNEIVKIVNK